MYVISASDWRRLPGCGLAREEELPEQLQHHQQAQPPPPDHTAGAGDDDRMPGGCSRLVAGEPRLAGPLLAQRARRRRAGELLVEVLPQHVHLVLLLRHREPLRSAAAMDVVVAVVLVGDLGWLLDGGEAPPVAVLVGAGNGDEEPRRRRGELGESEALAGPAALLRLGAAGECELFPHGCCETQVRSGRPSLYKLCVLVCMYICGALAMEVATPYLPF